MVQEAILGNNNKMIVVTQIFIDKDGGEYMTYHINLKQYVINPIKYDNNLEKFYSVIIRKYSPLIEQDFEADDSFLAIKLASDLIGLIKIF